MFLTTTNRSFDGLAVGDIVEPPDRLREILNRLKGLPMYASRDSIIGW